MRRRPSGRDKEQTFPSCHRYRPLSPTFHTPLLPPPSHANPSCQPLPPPLANLPVRPVSKSGGGPTAGQTGLEIRGGQTGLCRGHRPAVRARAGPDWATRPNRQAACYHAEKALGRRVCVTYLSGNMSSRAGQHMCASSPDSAESQTFFFNLQKTQTRNVMRISTQKILSNFTKK